MNKTLTPFNSFAVTALTASVTIGALAFAYNPDFSIQTAEQTAPAQTAVAAMHFTSANSGTAVIRLDGFTLDVSFDFERINDSYGVHGSEFTNADITNLSVDKVMDTSGYPIRDFTDFNDHLTINAMLVAHMLQNKMLEVA
ncbi:hypothetical protein D7V68_03835 [Acinetobacter cumulans]|uniref:hypothetical protein n=1 Tax=Acinetobacter cumulans TaxID=2136182 RepID=UPI000E9FFA40|nr:hypothetical protein [Acinetobacter cumulans]RKG50388.1 hypothetical protein D7V68_03835 [Acinetobacter cumulans]